MTISAPQFRACVIEPALTALAAAGIPNTKAAADLLMATAAVETELGTYLMQIRGPALGVFQVEPATLASALQRASQAELREIQGLAGSGLTIADQIAGNMILAAAVARLIYWQSPLPLPADTVVGLWSMYKSVWNTVAGATTEDEFTMALRLTDIVFTGRDVASA